MLRLLIYSLLLTLFNNSVIDAARIDIPKRQAHGFYPIERLEPERPRLIIALSGGGLRGAAHIGVLKALDDAGIVPDGIAGVSIGALVGGLYAVGYDPDEITTLLQGIDWSGILFDEPARPTLLLARKEEHSRHLLMFRLDRDLSPVVPGAVSPGQRLYRMLLGFTLNAPYRALASWNELRVPLNILATDLVSGREVYIRDGDPAIGIRASLSQPLLFDPVTKDTLQLIDGGISENIPVDLAREMRADIVLAVDATAELIPFTERYKPWQIVDIVTTIMEEEHDQDALRKADFAILPDFGDLGDVTIADAPMLVEAGYQSMREQLPALIEKLKPYPQSDDTTFLQFSAVEHLYDSRRSAAVQFSDSIHVYLPSSWIRNGGASVGDIREYMTDLLECDTVRDVHAEHRDSEALLSINVSLTPLIRNVTLVGDIVLDETLLLDQLACLKDQRVHFGEFQETLEGIVKIYRREGYPIATITSLQLDESNGSLEIGIDVGRLHSITFTGLNRISKTWLSREIPLRENEPIRSAGILKGMTNLYATGLFRKVYPVLKYDENTNPHWHLDLSVTEHPSLPVRLGLAYQGERRTRGFIEMGYQNPFYYASRLILFTSVGEHDRSYRLTLMADRILGWPLTYSLSSGFISRERKLYTSDHEVTAYYREESQGLRFEVGGQARSWGLLTLTSRFDQHDNGYYTGREQYDVAAFGVRLALDTQDRLPFPNRGMSFHSAAESGLNLGVGDDFNRIWGSWEAFITPVRRHTFGCRVSAATADRTTPFDQQFRLGGMESFPGLHLDEEVGALQFAGGIETRYDLISRFLSDTYLGIRYDVGGSWDDPQAQVLRRDWMSSVSVYFAFDTLLGPLKLQWGHLSDAGSATAQNLILLQAGNNF